MNRYKFRKDAFRSGICWKSDLTKFDSCRHQTNAKITSICIYKKVVNHKSTIIETPRKDSSNLHARPIILLARTCRTTSRNLRRSSSEARRNIQCRVPSEEVPRTKKQRHRFRRHDGEIFRGREMGQTKGVPQDDIGIVNGAVRSGCFDPGWNALRRLARGLWDVAAGRVNLVVGIYSKGSIKTYSLALQMEMNTYIW